MLAYHFSYEIYRSFLAFPSSACETTKMEAEDAFLRNFILENISILLYLVY
jgi:hypothetical protein